MSGDPRNVRLEAVDSDMTDADLAVSLPPTDVFIVDDDTPLAEVFHQVLERRGLSARTFAGRHELEAVPPDQWAHLIVLDLSLGESDAIEVMQMLARRNFDGAIALMSGRGEEALNQVQKIGLRHGLTMLPPLAKPIRGDQIDALVRYVGSLDQTQPRYDLDTALDAGWVEFWYQPKVELATRRTIGLETLARIRHPTAGVLAPTDFLPPKPTAALDRLAEAAIVAASRDWSLLRATGINVRMSVNAPISSLTSPDLLPLIRSATPVSGDWPGLIIEVTEDELIRDLEAAFELAVQLGLYDVDLSVDDFGTGHSSLARLKALPFAEIKIDKSFVQGASSDPKRAAICEMAVALARRFGRALVAEGLETAADVAALQKFGCEVGQGHFFAHPQRIEVLVGGRGDRAAPIPA